LSQVLSEQEYISYGKGTIAFDSIAEAIGRSKFHLVLQKYFQVYSSKSGVYPTSLDFVRLLKMEIEEEHHAMIDYWLLQINDVN